MTSKRQNKFADLLTAAREPEEQGSSAAEVLPAAQAASYEQQVVASAPSKNPVPQEAAVSTTRRGRPATGKRSNPDYEQVTVYLRKDTSLAAKIALLQESDSRDFSDLVEELLGEWLRDR